MNLVFAGRQRPKVAEQAFNMLGNNGTHRVPLVGPLHTLVSHNLCRVNGSWWALKGTWVLLSQAGNTASTLDPGNASPAGPEMVLLPDLDAGCLFLGRKLVVKPVNKLNGRHRVIKVDKREALQLATQVTEHTANFCPQRRRRLIPELPEPRLKATQSPQSFGLMALRSTPMVRGGS